MNCQIFTPPYIVNLMLDKIGYINDNIRNKTIFEPSFGDGAFLVSIVDRILKYACKNNMNNDDIYKMLDNVYGVEIDQKYFDITIQKLNKKLLEHGLGYDWKNLVCMNTLKYKPTIQFDFVVGNPPYVKIQDLSNRTKKYIAENFQYGSGNTDLYVVFFEKCMSLLNNNGILSFITPNSYFKNSSQANFRGCIGKYVDEIIDYGDVIIFDNIATYTAITTINMQEQTCRKYVRMSAMDKKDFESPLYNLGNAPWQFSSLNDAEFIENIKSRPNKLGNLCTIQHGLATNADHVYVIKDVSKFERGILRPIVKASTLKGYHVIFPYTWNKKTERYDIIPEDIMKTKYPKTYNYLLGYKNLLDTRDMDRTKGEWYQYARSQGLHNSRKKKIVFKHILSGQDKECSYVEVGPNTLTYSGIYIIPYNEEDCEKIKEILSSPEFCRYLLIVGKNMSGGYKSVNTKMLADFGFE